MEFGLVLIVKSYCEKKEEESTSRPGSSDQTVRPQTGNLAWNKPVKHFQKHLLHLSLTLWESKIMKERKKWKNCTFEEFKQVMTLDGST